jgi:hypothetical protein
MFVHCGVLYLDTIPFKLVSLSIVEHALHHTENIRNENHENLFRKDLNLMNMKWNSDETEL